MSWNCGGRPTGSMYIQVSTFSLDPYVRIQCTYTDRWTSEKTDQDYRIRLTTTRPNYGGVRWWFVCPLSRNGRACDRRVGVLYLGGRYFGCRRCYRLPYDKQANKPPASLGIIGEMIDLETEIDDAEAKIRVRYWKDRPTKRYSRILKKRQRLYNLGSDMARIEMLEKALRK
ncbi:MAG: hypothetical protein ABIJ46_03335 [bacterium]